MSRFMLRAILAAFFAWLLGGAPSVQAAATPPSNAVIAYDYDGQQTPANRAAPASERGLPLRTNTMPVTPPTAGRAALPRAWPARHPLPSATTTPAGS